MNEVLLIDKPTGVTSYDVVAKLKKLLQTKKIGHSGTLDKFASGLLVVCTGWATKLNRYLIDCDKGYTGTVRLGITTDTCDIEGKIIEERDVSGLGIDQVLKIKERFSGDISQTPPLYSALKIGGKRASDLIREGKIPVLKERTVSILKLDIRAINLDNSRLTIDVDCSKGTYIRALARDIGQFLGTGGHLESLRRTRLGIFNVSNAVTLEEYAEFLKGREISKKFRYNPGEVLTDFGTVIIKEDKKSLVLNGASFNEDDTLEIQYAANNPFRILDTEKNLIAIANIDTDNWKIKYLNVFNRK